MTLFATDEILPPQPAGGSAIHDREYRVRAFRRAPDRIVIQGGVRDQKPPGRYLSDDAEPLTTHHMQLSIEIEFPSLEIVGVDVHFESHPDAACPTIAVHDRDDGWKRNINTCHVWAEDGEAVAARRSGAPSETPLFLTKRLATLGIEPPRSP